GSPIRASSRGPFGRSSGPPPPAGGANSSDAASGLARQCSFVILSRAHRDVAPDRVEGPEARGGRGLAERVVGHLVAEPGKGGLIRTVDGAIVDCLPPDE